MQGEMCLQYSIWIADKYWASLGKSQIICVSSVWRTYFYKFFKINALPIFLNDSRHIHWNIKSKLYVTKREKGKVLSATEDTLLVVKTENLQGSSFMLASICL